jgi:DNA-binding PadR family transcriptional regulator
MGRKTSGVTLVSSQKGKAVGVPRGLLRFLVLKMLSEKPMSGIEIAEQIEKQTGGLWKPSPGSLYPLLAWMLKKGFTREEPKAEEGLKRYSFTEKGSEFLNKQVALGEDFRNKMEFLLPLLVGGLQFGSNKEKLRGTIEPAKKLLSAFMVIRHNLEDVSEEDLQAMVQALTRCSERLETIAYRFRMEGST